MQLATLEGVPRGVRLEDVTRSLNHWIEVDLDALAANARCLASTMVPARLMGVVKANAYGHGASEVASALMGAGVEMFAVAWLSEAKALREAGITATILAMEHCFPADATQIVALDVAVTCHSRELAVALSMAAVASGRIARIHVKVDTGLHRFGLDLSEAISLAEYARSLPGVLVQGLWTHMANADEADDGFSDIQSGQFDVAVAALPWIPLVHAANSASGLRRAGLRFDAVRAGVSLYGVIPDNTPDPGLTPVLSLKARIARVTELRPGEGVSYGLTWRAPSHAKVALVPVGYADGWRRSLGNVGFVLISGVRCPIAGRVCMDQFIANVTGVQAVEEGDEVVLIGSQGGMRITAAEVAALTDTIPWETLAGLGTRIPRIYHRSGVVVGPS